MNRRWQAIDAGSAVLSAVLSMFVAPVAFVMLMFGSLDLMNGLKLQLSEMIALIVVSSAFAVPVGAPFVAAWWFCLTAVLLILQMISRISLPIVLFSSIAVGVVLMLVMPFAKWYGIPTSNGTFAAMAGAASLAGYAYWIINTLPASGEEF